MASSREQRHRLFFALRPDPLLREELLNVVAKLQNAGIRGRWLAADKLHLTLQFLGDFVSPQEIVRRAVDAADGLRVAPFEFVLDRAESFARRFNPPCVLRCAETSATPLRALAEQLATALGTAGLRAYLDARPYVPHVTVAYAESVLPNSVPIAPIVWHAREFALIDSLVGTSVYEEIVRWLLRA